MKTLLFVDHAFHQKTNSTKFLQDLLKEKYFVEMCYVDPYTDNLDECFSKLNGKKYDVLIIFQQMTCITSLKKYISFEQGILFPMYDACVNMKHPLWKEYRHFNIINFSKTLHKQLKKMGYSSYYFQFFPKPLSFKNWGEEARVFFWQRTSKININNLITILPMQDVKHIHIHKAVDPEHKFINPNVATNCKFSYSDWFPTKQDMYKEVEQAALYIAPRVYEGIGMSFLEAMSMGRCVIAVNNPTMNEYIKNGKNGILFNENSQKNIKLKHIRKIQKNAFLYMKKGYQHWEEDKKQILQILETKAKFSKRINEKTYKLLGFLPILSKEKDKNTYYLFNILPIFTVKINKKNKKYYLFNKILLLKIETHE